MIKRIVKLISVLALFSSMVNSTKASEKNPDIENNQFETIMYLGNDIENVKIEYKMDQNGVQTFIQYTNGVLTDKNIIDPSRPGEVIKYVFDDGIASPSILVISDYIEIEETIIKTNLVPLAILTLGTINYQGFTDQGTELYGVRITYDTINHGNTVYQIRSYVGTVVDLVSLLIGAMAIPFVFINPYVTALIASAGITIIGGKITNAFSTAVTSLKFEYKMLLTNTTFAGHTKTVNGYRYYITDSNYATGKNYYEGYTPNDWKTQNFGINIHYEMFSNSNFSIVSWS